MSDLASRITRRIPLKDPPSLKESNTFVMHGKVIDHAIGRVGPKAACSAAPTPG